MKIKEWFKKYFIPHEGNDHKPHFFRSGNVITILSGVLLLEIVFIVQVFIILPRTNYYASILPTLVIDITNKNRANLGEISLLSNDELTKAAQMKAEDMARKGYFSHQGPNGEAPWTWFERAGYNFLYAGENLAVNFVDSEDVVSAWMKSETHKRNILNGKFREIGIGVAKGKYEGRDALFVVQFFGTPAEAAVKTQKSQPPSVSVPTQKKAVSSAPSPTGKSYLAFATQLATQPRVALDFIYIVLITMIVLAFFLMVFIKFHIQYPHLIMNGAVMLLFIGSLFVLNHYLTVSQIKIF